jgi:hypothetical protein
MYRGMLHTALLPTLQIKASFLPMFGKFVQYKNCVREQFSSLRSILQIERIDILNLRDPSLVDFHGLPCIPMRSASTFCGEGTAGAEVFFFLHDAFLFKFTVQIKNSVSCRCPISVETALNILWVAVTLFISA